MSSMSRRHLMLAATGSSPLRGPAPRLRAGRARCSRPDRPLHAAAADLFPNALEPHIDAKTMEIHHDRHHAAYVANLNNVAKDNPQIADKPVEEVLANLNAVPEAIRTGVRNNCGGHANHTMFWQIMGPAAASPRARCRCDRPRSRRLGNSRTTSTPRAAACSARAGYSSPSPRTASSRSRPARTRTTR